MHHGAGVLVHTDFEVLLGRSAAIGALRAMRGLGELSRGSYWSELARRGFLGPQFDPEREKVVLDGEGGDELSPDGLGKVRTASGGRS